MGRGIRRRLGRHLTMTSSARAFAAYSLPTCDQTLEIGGTSGSDDGGGVNATLVSLLASCEMHGIEPYAYLRDLLCLVPAWPQTRVLELAPANWKATSARAEVVAQLETNVYRQVTLGTRLPANENPKAS